MVINMDIEEQIKQMEKEDELNKLKKRGLILKFLRYCTLDHSIDLSRENAFCDRTVLKPEEDIELVDKFLEDDKNIEDYCSVCGQVKCDCEVEGYK